MSEPTRVLVVGSGMAGVIAALSAARAGAEVTVVRRSFGATALSSGAIDVAADLHAPGGDLASQRISPQAAAEELARVRPLHPYAVLKAALSRLPEALAFAQRHLEALIAPPAELNRLLPTPLGTVKPTALAQRSMVDADLGRLPARFAVISLPLFPAHDARLIAEGLRRSAAALGRAVEPVVVEVPALRELEDALRTPFELAQRLEAPGEVTRWARLLKEALPPGIEVALFPPVLGRSGSGLCEALSAETKVRCVETVATTPSLPGVRLQEALDHALAAQGITLLEAELQPAAFAGGPFVLSDGKVIAADAVVLATGKYIGGGIVRAHSFEEPLFNLPVFAGGKLLGDEFVGDLLGEGVVSEHTAFRAGVRIDANLQPVGVDGRAVSPHLFAAGSVIAGYDPALDKSGLGVAIFTGFLAGENAANVTFEGR